MDDSKPASPKITLYDKRAVVSYDLGRICGFECKFCYHYKDLGVSQVSSKEEAYSLIEGLDRSTFEIITPGCEQELFINPKKAVEFINHLSKLNKVISFSTRTLLSGSSLESLTQIDHNLKADNNYIVIEFSFVSGKNRPDIESMCPSTDRRIETMNQAANKGIYVVPFLRPILPEEIVSLDEIEELVHKTCNFSEAYALGDFYFDNVIEKNLNLRRLGPSFWDRVTGNAEAIL